LIDDVDEAVFLVSRTQLTEDASFKFVPAIHLGGMTYCDHYVCIAAELCVQAMLGWGKTLRKWYGRSVNAGRQLDISNDYIGYFTDNGNVTVNSQRCRCLLYSFMLWILLLVFVHYEMK